MTLATGKDPEGTLEWVLDQVYAVWATGGGGDSAAEARAHQFRLNHLERFAAVQLAREAESLRDRSLERALLTHLTGNPAFLREELAAITSLGAGDISAFAYRWLNRGRARAVLVEPQDTGPLAPGAVPPVFASVSTLRLSVPPGTLERRAIPPGATVRTFRMENGLEVVLARRPAAPVAAVTLVSRGGRADAVPLGAGELVSLAEIGTPVTGLAPASASGPGAGTDAPRASSSSSPPTATSRTRWRCSRSSSSPSACGRG